MKLNKSKTFLYAFNNIRSEVYRINIDDWIHPLNMYNNGTYKKKHISYC